ncbi:GNAT family N-acetyltransferase [Dongia deserti]|uniref:GNAT family N-acetyltransferase n=1 Tax=Dongia deserti TaxID=2268030 RepID=UPI0013C435A5|nr:GNAT family N-acetyltransferase [Dongia deserti]
MRFEIRHPHRDEHDRVQSLVSTVVNETYGSIWPTTPIQVGDEDWGSGWVAAIADDLLGWILTRDHWVEDLWVLSGCRGQGVGSALLTHGEKEIAARGVATAHLYVIASNAPAIAFYERCGWQHLREVPHELLSIPRLEMTKTMTRRRHYPT